MFERQELKEGVDFQIVSVNDEELGIYFEGLTFMIDYVNVDDEEDGNGNAILHFNYRVVASESENEEDEEVIPEEYEQKLGAIIEKMLIEEFQYQTNGE